MKLPILITLSLLVASIMLMSLNLFSGCAPKSEEPKDTLLIWCSEGNQPLIQKLGTTYTQSTGIPVKALAPKGIEHRYATQAATPQGPDIVLWAHDRVGQWAAAKTILPVTLPPHLKDAFFESSLVGLMYHDTLWGYPVALEVSTLIYNTAFVSSQKVPATIDQFKKLSFSTVPYKILFEYNNPYFTWPFLAGVGGYVYGKDSTGNYNTKDRNIYSHETVQVLTKLSAMITADAMPNDLTYTKMMTLMTTQQCAMMVNGPWSWSALDQAGISFDIAPIPGHKGPTKPFSGVKTVMINAYSSQPDNARDFIENYLLKDSTLYAFSKRNFNGPSAMKSVYEKQKSDPRIAKSFELFHQAVLMPNIPAMNLFWNTMEVAIRSVTSGRATPEEALKTAENHMDIDISGQQ